MPPVLHDTAQYGRGGTPVSAALTTTSGVQLIVACVQVLTADVTISSVVWNGSAMTQAVSAGGTKLCRIYYALDSTPRTASAVLTLSAGSGQIVVFSLRGVNVGDIIRVTGSHEEGAWLPAYAEEHGPTLVSDPTDLVVSQAYTDNTEGGDVARAGDLTAYIHTAGIDTMVASGVGDSSFLAKWTQDSTPDNDGYSRIVAISIKGGLVVTLTGAMTPAGAFSKEVTKVFTGAMTPAGTLVKLAQLVRSGTVTMSGALGAMVRLLALVGSITPTGSLLSRLVFLIHMKLLGVPNPTSNLRGMPSPSGKMKRE